jgi:hypothetical protein
MARDKVQFQRGLSDVEFDRLYGTEEKCREALFSWRWPDGFECPVCGGFAHCELEKRALWLGLLISAFWPDPHALLVHPAVEVGEHGLAREAVDEIPDVVGPQRGIDLHDDSQELRVSKRALVRNHAS